MRRAAWIFFALIVLPSLGLAWLAIQSVRDQQVVLEHQQAIICQNVTDTLAKNVQAQMDQVRADFVTTTQQLFADGAAPESVARDFNRKLREAWPLAEIGFAVNLDGEIYSPRPYDSAAAKTFRAENDSFLSNRENVEVYSSNIAGLVQNAAPIQNAASQFALKLPLEKAKNEVASDLLTSKQVPDQSATRAKDGQEQKSVDALKKLAPEAEAQKAPVADAGQALSSGAGAAAPGPALDAERKEQPAALPNAAAAPAGGTDLQGKMESTSSARASHLAPATLDKAAAAKSEPQTVTVAPAATEPESATTAIPAADATALPAAPATPPPAPVVIATPAAAPAAAPEGGARSDLPAPATITGTAQEVDALANSRSEGNVNAAPVFAKIRRQVIPQQMAARDSASLSNTVPEESDFRRVIGSETSGELARFLEDKLRLMVWSHASSNAPIVFGAQIDLAKLTDALKSALPASETARDSFSRSSGGDVCVAILDDKGHPVVQSRPGFAGDWKHPFVATEIGEVLPHWEAALYLVDPHQISRAARTVQCTILLIVVLLVLAILFGGTTIAQDWRRQMRLAQQKTDFVSNVSHELKTPLTSIRMFADLLAEKRVPDEERQATYLRIIAAEASRLTRLINNVLDFARLEKGLPHGQPGDCDLVEAARDVAETCAPHLEAAQIAFQCEIEAESLPVRADRDELAQIILNLISNAEKYGGNDILVRVRRQETAAGALGCVDVLDRGAGIPARQVKSVFEPFHRLEDSLSSGIPGSGLGLTLARRMARAHGGDVTYSARAGGGSCFTLAVPLMKSN